MKLKVKNQNRFLAAVTAVFFAAVIMLAAFCPVTVKAEANQAVTDARTGVLQVNLVYTSEQGEETPIKYGSGILINENTLLTCTHVLNLTDEETAQVAQHFEIDATQVAGRISYNVTVRDDVSIPATVKNSSDDHDYAIMQLSQSIQNKQPLSIRSSSDVEQTENVYTMGFPDSGFLETFNTYTSDDVTIREGVVNKVTYAQNIYRNTASTQYIVTSAIMSAGNSGGPLVDENGDVIGICQGSAPDGTAYYAIAIDPIAEVLEALGIQYTKADTIIPVVTDETTKATQAATTAEEVTEAAEVVPVQEETIAPTTQAAQPEQSSGLSTTTLICIIAAVVVVIIVVVIIIVIVNKKKKAAAAAPNAPSRPSAPAAPQAAPKPQSQGFTPAQPVPPAAPRTTPADAGQTTILSGAGETTILTRAVDSGKLIHSKTGETVSINVEEFVIGRERTKVNYCIAGNTSVGRTHAKIVNKNGSVYLVDLNATNGTFVNGVKCIPRQEVLLKSGDKITFADEEYTYQA